MNRDSVLRGVVKELDFDSASGDFDRASALAHVKAIVLLAAAQKAVTEDTYIAALSVVDSDEARRNDEDAVGEQCRAAEALSDLAQENLRLRGIFWSSAGYENEYVAEVGRVAREHGLDYRPGHKGA